MNKPAASPLFTRLEAMGRKDARAGRPAQWGRIYAMLLDAIGSSDDFSQDFAARLYSFYRKGYKSAVVRCAPVLMHGRF